MKPKTIGVSEARTQFSRILEAVGRGDVFHVTRRGKPIAEIRAIAGSQRPRTPGFYKGQVHLSEDFDAPLDDFAVYRG